MRCFRGSISGPNVTLAPGKDSQFSKNSKTKTKPGVEMKTCRIQEKENTRLLT